jgi:4-alpha-glucanotransferase
MKITRKSGILLHISSLPSEYGIGDLGSEAYEFIDRISEYGIKTPDSIQIATANYASADYFLTNDIRLKAVKEIKVLALDEII